MTVEELRKHYPVLEKHEPTPVDVVDDGETLSSVEDGSVDFVIASHLLEYCQNPIGAVENHLRVLKAGGILYTIVPDKRFTFDSDRPVTTLEHLLRDYREGPAWSKRSHYEEWARLVTGKPEEEVERHANQLIDNDYSIHFHVWSQSEFLQLLLYCRDELSFPLDIELVQRNAGEVVCVLKKQVG
jgi:SAM-dependent methyltransferase